MRKPIARHLILDMYNCKKLNLADEQVLVDAVTFVAEALDAKDYEIRVFANGDCKHIFASLGCVCVSVHAYQHVNFAAVDIYAATEDADMVKIRALMRKAFKPGAIKITNFKRGDFGVQKDPKPKSKTRVTARKRMRDAGGKIASMIKKSTKKMKMGKKNPE